MDQRRKIVLLHPSLAVAGGAERAFLWLADELAGRGHQVTVLTQAYDGTRHGDLARKKYPVVFFPFGRNDEEIPWDGLEPEIAKLARLLKPFDLINAHNFPAYLWAAWAKKHDPALGPLVWYCEEPFRQLYEKEMQERYRPWLDGPPSPPGVLMMRQRLKPFLSKVKRTILKQPVPDPARAVADHLARIRQMDKNAVAGLDLVLANSAFTARQVTRIFGVPAQPCLLGCPSLAKVAGKRPAEENYFMTATRLYPIKNLVRAIEAVGLLKQQGQLSGWRYLIVGDGDKAYRQEVLRSIAGAGLEQEVVLKDFVSEDRLAGLMSKAAFVLCPSLEEPFGLVPLEAASLGRPAVASDHGGYAETVRHGQTGLLADPFSAEALAQAIGQMLGDQELRRRLGQNALAGYEENFTAAKFADRWQAAIWPRFGL